MPGPLFRKRLLRIPYHGKFSSPYMRHSHTITESSSETLWALSSHVLRPTKRFISGSRLDRFLWNVLRPLKVKVGSVNWQLKSYKSGVIWPVQRYSRVVKSSRIPLASSSTVRGSRLSLSICSSASLFPKKLTTSFLTLKPKISQ